MRRFLFASSLLLALASPGRGIAAPLGFAEAQREYETTFDAQTRQIMQVWLIVGGYTNVVPTEHFSTHTFKALQQFEVENGFAPTGRLDKAQVDRLVTIVDAKYALWGLRRVVFPGRAATVWVPFGLELDAKANGSGLHYKDRLGRLSLDFVSLPNGSMENVHRAMLAEKRAKGWDVHYEAMKDDWFVVSTTAPDGSDHYYRYHQDGDLVTGFALEWNNAAGNINGERIAVLNSAVLGASMKGAPFIDPPNLGVEASAPAAQPAAVPVTPAPPPQPKTSYSSGTGFFVTADGSFVTNAHVVADCSDIAVKADDGSVNKATRVATDTENDLALLKLAKVAARVAPIRVGGRLGEGVEAFGFPHSDLLSSSGNFTLGNITAMSGLRDDSRYLQMSAPVQAGNSGGPLLDSSGNLVGIVAAKLDAIKMAVADGDLPQNVNFAVKSAMLAAFLDANRVTYKVGAPAAVALPPADIADQARAMSGFVVCR